MKSWLPKLFGTIAALAQVAPNFGHIGSVSINQAIGVIFLTALGWVTKQSNVTGGTVGQNGGTVPAVPSQVMKAQVN